MGIAPDVIPSESGTAAAEEPHVPQRAAKRTRRTIAFQTAAPPGSRVSVAGTFNNWSPDSNPLDYQADRRIYRTTLHLAPGHYEYKFVIDGQWHIDCACPHWIPNDSGGLNSVIHV